MKAGKAGAAATGIALRVLPHILRVLPHTHMTHVTRVCVCLCLSLCHNTVPNAARQRLTAAIHTGTVHGAGAGGASKGHAAGAGDAAGGGASVKRPLTAGPALGVSKRSRA